MQVVAKSINPDTVRVSLVNPGFNIACSSVSHNIFEYAFCTMVLLSLVMFPTSLHHLSSESFNKL